MAAALAACTGDTMETIVIDRNNRNRHGALLEQLFRVRHPIFAGERRWVPASADGLERDQFDTAATAYIVFVEAGSIIAGSRLIESPHPHLAGEVFGGRFPLPPGPRDPSVVEWTRGFIVPERRSAGLVAHCCTEIMQYCVGQGYRQIGGLQDRRWLAVWARLGWSVRLYGGPVVIDGEEWLPAYCEVSEAALAASRRRLATLGNRPGAASPR